MVDFKERLRSIRKLKKVTQKQVAQDIGLTERNYQDWELGSYKPGFDALIALCRYFNVSADYLLGLSDEVERK